MRMGVTVGIMIMVFMSLVPFVLVIMAALRMVAVVVARSVRVPMMFIEDLLR
jgi:hypothetical protein